MPPVSDGPEQAHRNSLYYHLTLIDGTEITLSSTGPVDLVGYDFLIHQLQVLRPYFIEASAIIDGEAR
jgi:hypothetical protein